jgi:hypothetical protein
MNVILKLKKAYFAKFLALLKLKKTFTWSFIVNFSVLAALLIFSY